MGQGTAAAGAISMRAYSTDLRERIVRAVAGGLRQREAARRFWVGVTSVRRYLAQYQQAGSLERKPIPGCPRRIGRAQEAILLARLAEAPAPTGFEHRAWSAEHQGQQR